MCDGVVIADIHQISSEYVMRWRWQMIVDSNGCSTVSIAVGYCHHHLIRHSLKYCSKCYR